jgi:hypothetical protein
MAFGVKDLNPGAFAPGLFLYDYIHIIDLRFNIFVNSTEI